MTKINTHHSGGKCSICGKVKRSTKKVFLQEGWFRGDDTYLGKCCKDYQCRKQFREKYNLDCDVY